MADHLSRAGHRYGTADALRWTDALHAPHDHVLAQAFATPDGVPAIMVGPSDGKTLHLLMRLLDARRVVEVGTLVGYSTIHLARGMAPDGQIWTVEFEPRHAAIARANLEAAGLAQRVTVCEGAGTVVLPSLTSHGPFDAVFIDADKENYPAYGEWALANLRPGGLVIGDNAYLFGELLADDARGRAMRRFHELVAASCDSVCVPTGEGLVVGVKR
jgi:caffeoyl-CoA O-methyltransferase